jgi:sugar phosphate isomerase/epimerase
VHLLKDKRLLKGAKGMRLGIFTVLFQQLSFEAMLDRVAAYGVQAIELGVGGYPGNHHCPVDRLLESADARARYLDAIHARGLSISALCGSCNPLHPDPTQAAEAQAILRRAIQLAALLGVPVVTTLSGIPGGAPGDRTPNWITCPWPPEYLTMLDYQWERVAIPLWQELARYAADRGVSIGIEMHPGMLVYNVETLLRLRESVGPAICCNFDPSHLFWNNVDPVAAIHALGEAIVHVHGKDCMVNHAYVSIHGCNDGKPYTRVAQRAWTFRTIGYGHDSKTWKDIATALRIEGYDGVISIEHEDILLSPEEGLAKALAVLKEAIPSAQPGSAYWI